MADDTDQHPVAGRTGELLVHGRALLGEGRYDEAVAAFDQGMRRDNDDPDFLAGAAYLLERHLPRLLQGGDIRTDEWLRDRAAGMAVAVRSLKRRLLVPSTTGWEKVRSDLERTMMLAAVGSWNELP